MATATAERPREAKIPTVADERKLVQAELAGQPKYRIALHQNPAGQEQMGDQFAQINGHGFQIQRGKMVEVPESLYLILVQSGQVTPQRPEDEAYVPRMTYQGSLEGGRVAPPLSEQTPQNDQ